MTVLELIQRFCRRTGISIPATVIGSTDAQILQAYSLIEEEGNALASRHNWQGLTKEANHSTIASEDQGAITTIADSGFRYIRNNTIWDTNDRLPVIGPLNGQEWQALKAVAVNGPRFQFRIRGNRLLVNPIPPAGNTWKFEYASKNWILDVDGVTTKEFITADSDTFIIPDYLLLLGLRWRWMREKGLDYGELFNSYEIQVNDEMNRDGGAPRLSMDGIGIEVKPGIFVPNGNWTVP